MIRLRCGSPVYRGMPVTLMRGISAQSNGDITYGTGLWGIALGLEQVGSRSYMTILSCGDGRPAIHRDTGNLLGIHTDMLCAGWLPSQNRLFNLLTHPGLADVFTRMEVTTPTSVIFAQRWGMLAILRLWAARADYDAFLPHAAPDRYMPHWMNYCDNNSPNEGGSLTTDLYDIMQPAIQSRLHGGYGLLDRLSRSQFGIEIEDSTESTLNDPFLTFSNGVRVVAGQPVVADRNSLRQRLGRIYKISKIRSDGGLELFGETAPVNSQAFRPLSHTEPDDYFSQLVTEDSLHRMANDHGAFRPTASLTLAPSPPTSTQRGRTVYARPYSFDALSMGSPIEYKLEKVTKRVPSFLPSSARHIALRMPTIAESTPEAPVYRTRIAPSPTGDMHLGTARTAYFNWLAARATKGSFLLRIDDTDAARNKPEHTEVILETMDWLGLKPDGIVYQSSPEAMASYNAYAHVLLGAERAIKTEDGAIILKLTEDQCPLSWTDELNGIVPVTDDDTQHICEGIVLMRRPDADGISRPTYHFACVVDDIEFSINYIIRGVDHFTNTSRQVAIYQALGHTVPKFAHVGLIYSGGKKLSKRDGASSLLKYRADGVHPDALLNFMARMGWGPAVDDKTTAMLDRERMQSLFVSGGSMRAAPSGMDMAKLKWYDKKYKALTKGK